MRASQSSNLYVTVGGFDAFEPFFVVVCVPRKWLGGMRRRLSVASAASAASACAASTSDSQEVMQVYFRIITFDLGFLGLCCLLWLLSSCYLLRLLSSCCLVNLMLRAPQQSRFRSVPIMSLEASQVDVHFVFAVLMIPCFPHLHFHMAFINDCDCAALQAQRRMKLRSWRAAAGSRQMMPPQHQRAYQPVFPEHLQLPP